MQGDAAEILKPETFQRGASSVEKAAVLPSLTTEYKAAGTPENGEVSRLVLVMGQDGFRPGGTAYVFMQYAHIGLGQFGFTVGEQDFSFVFSDIRPKLVVVHGRNLLRICDYVSLRRMPWIRQADRDFQPGDGAADSEPFIRLIEIRDWKPPRSQAADLARHMEVHEEPEMEDA
jgi:hypothetical protein